MRLLGIELLRDHVLDDFGPLLLILFTLCLEVVTFLGRDQLETKPSIAIDKRTDSAQQKMEGNTIRIFVVITRESLKVSIFDMEESPLPFIADLLEEVSLKLHSLGNVFFFERRGSLQVQLLPDSV